MGDVPDVPFRDVMDELRRELGVRRALFPQWVNDGRIRQDTADHRIACLEALLTFFGQRKDWGAG